MRADADPLGHRAAIGFAEQRLGPGVVVLADDLIGPLDRFVQQPGQADGRAGAGFEGPAVFAEHRAEGDVLEFDVAIAPQPGGGEQLLEVERLAMIDDVENRVRPPLVQAILDRGQVGRGVEKRAVLFLDDHRARLAFEKDANRPVALSGQALCRLGLSPRRAAGPDKSSRPACGRTRRRAAA